MVKLLCIIVLNAAAGVFSPHVLSAQGCDAGMLTGSYGYSATGFVPVGQKGGPIRFDPIANVAVATYDGKGKVSLRVTIQYHGAAGPLSLDGTYKVDSNCTGAATLQNNDGASTNWRFVIVEGRNQIETLAVTPASSHQAMYSMTFSQKKF